MTSWRGLGPDMELAFVFLVVVFGMGVIVYAGLRKPVAASADTAKGEA